MQFKLKRIRTFFKYQLTLYQLTHTSVYLRESSCYFLHMCSYKLWVRPACPISSSIVTFLVQGVLEREIEYGRAGDAVDSCAATQL